MRHSTLTRGHLIHGESGPSRFEGPRIALGSPVRFGENSLCRIYSMAKPVTGVAAMALVEEGRLSLDQPVADVLPELRSQRVAIDLEKSMESRPAEKTMTMRHLLTHTSGLSYWTPLSGVGALPTAYREHDPEMHGGLHGPSRCGARSNLLPNGVVYPSETTGHGTLAGTRAGVCFFGSSLHSLSGIHPMVPAHPAS